MVETRVGCGGPAMAGGPDDEGGDAMAAGGILGDGTTDDGG